jgi:hypothetical protein
MSGFDKSGAAGNELTERPELDLGAFSFSGAGSDHGFDVSCAATA